ncbi:MAG: erythromycin esterase family protein [Actinomycetota bacterium]|nr:erythromycin esterase family protein [Actinomycetota bacterium]
MRRYLDDMRELALPLTGQQDLDPLLARVGDARIVLLGEASHGTHEYYTWRTAITQRLVAELGFSFVAVEGDWPDCEQVDRAVTLAAGAPADPRAALASYERWPTWMWANEEVADLVTWLRDWNAGRDPHERVGFHGLDVYSLWDSLRAILRYLEEHEPGAVETALSAFRCLEPYGEDPQEYALATRWVPQTCENAVIEILCTLRDRTPGDGEDAFAARQNAEVAVGAERYYRAMVRGGPASWNLRDTHMADTLDRLLEHYGDGAKAVVWEHNTHVGDARHTDMARRGLVNVGQLARERHGEDDVVIVGFGSARGTVVAGDSWGAPHEVMPLPPARSGSLEALLSGAGISSALFVHPRDVQPEWLTDRLDHRAVGVVYNPAYDHVRNYVPTVVGRRYDAFVFLDETRALRPLPARASGGEAETFPTGL